MPPGRCVWRILGTAVQSVPAELSLRFQLPKSVCFQLFQTPPERTYELLPACGHQLVGYRARVFPNNRGPFVSRCCAIQPFGIFPTQVARQLLSFARAPEIQKHLASFCQTLEQACWSHPTSSCETVGYG